MPYYIAFIYNTDDDLTFWAFLDLLVDICFTIDVIVNLLLPYLDNKGRWVKDRCKIFLNYLKGFLIIDIASAIPIDFIFSLLERSPIGNNLLRFLRIGRLYKLVKITRVVGIFKRGKKNLFAKCREFCKFNTGWIRFFQFLISTMMFVHLTGCLWFYVARLQNFSQDSWVTRVGLTDESNFTLYITSIYWAFQTLLTVGYGDINAFTISELIMAILWMMIGAGFYTFTIGTLSSVVYNRDSRKNFLNNKLNNIQTFCKHININSQLRDKLKKTVYFSSQRKIAWFVKLKIFQDLPQNIKSEIARRMDDGLVEKILFLKDKQASFIGTIVPILVPQDVHAGELIFKVGDHSHSIFFIKKGTVSFVLTFIQRIYQQFEQGSQFGDSSILLSDRRDNTVVTCQNCILFSLSKKAIESIIRNEYPQVYSEMVDLAEQKSIKTGMRKRIAIHQAVRTYIICKCPTLGNIFEEPTYEQSDFGGDLDSPLKSKYPQSGGVFRRLTMSSMEPISPNKFKSSSNNNNFNNINNINVQRSQMFQYSKYTPYQFSKMITHCVQREVNIGGNQWISDEQLNDLIESCNKLQDSLLYKKLQMYQRFGKLADFKVQQNFAMNNYCIKQNNNAARRSWKKSSSNVEKLIGSHQFQRGQSIFSQKDEIQALNSGGSGGGATADGGNNKLGLSRLQSKLNLKSQLKIKIPQFDKKGKIIKKQDQFQTIQEKQNVRRNDILQISKYLLNLNDIMGHKEQQKKSRYYYPRQTQINEESSGDCRSSEGSCQLVRKKVTRKYTTPTSTQFLFDQSKHQDNYSFETKDELLLLQDDNLFQNQNNIGNWRDDDGGVVKKTKQGRKDQKKKKKQKKSLSKKISGIQNKYLKLVQKADSLVEWMAKQVKK